MALEMVGGAKRPAAQMNPRGLHWMAFTETVRRMAGDSLALTEAGGLKITNPKLAASIMDGVYSGRVKIQERFDVPRVGGADVDRIRSDVRAMNQTLAIQLFQRLLDMESSYDLRGFANLVYGQLAKRGFNLTVADLLDPAMTKLLNLPGCAVLGCTYGPKFALTATDEADKGLLIYDAGSFGGSGSNEYVFNPAKDRFEMRNGLVGISKNGGSVEEAVLPWAFAYAFSQAGLSGLRLTMTSYQPETAIGGMGMSNNLLDAILYNLHFLLNTGATLGDIYSQGGYVEKMLFGRETGKQESQQNVSGGHNILLNAPGLFGGIMRRLDLSGQTQDILGNLHLAVYARPLGKVERPHVNDEWVRLSLYGPNAPVFMYQKYVAQREVSPFIQAANQRSLIDWPAVIAAYDEHRAIRDIMCHGYVGTPEQIAFYEKIRELGGSFMPLGEGTLTAACGLFLSEEQLATLGLNPITAADALRTEGKLTGLIPYQLLDRMPEWGLGYEALAAGEGYGYPRPALQLIEYQG